MFLPPPSSLNAPPRPTRNANAFSLFGALCFPVIVIVTVIIKHHTLSTYYVPAATLQGGANTKPIVQISQLRLGHLQTEGKSFVGRHSAIKCWGRNRSQI